MPDTSVSRQKIRDYFESKGISLVSVATYFDIPRQDLISTFTKSDRRNENGKFLRYIFKKLSIQHY